MLFFEARLISIGDVNQLEQVADKSLAEFLSLVGFRDPIIDHDTHLLPQLKKALKNTPYAALEIGEPVPNLGFEHAVRFLGDEWVIKYVSPEPISLMKTWVAAIKKQKELLFKYLPSNLVPFDYFFVPVDEERPVLSERTGLSADSPKATYMVVMEKVGGKPLADLSDEELFSNKALVKSLLEFFEGNTRLYEDHGVCVDILGYGAQVLNPRYSRNIHATGKGRAIVVDTILIPREFHPEKVPAKYYLRALYHSIYDHLVKPIEDAFVQKLQENLR